MLKSLCFVCLLLFRGLFRDSSELMQTLDSLSFCFLFYGTVGLGFGHSVCSCLSGLVFVLQVFFLFRGKHAPSSFCRRWGWRADWVVIANSGLAGHDV